MNKVAEWLSKWAFAIFLGFLAIGLVVSIVCGIHTALTNLTVGLVGIGIDLLILAFVIGWLCVEIKEGKL